jgi:hypothetical protein
MPWITLRDALDLIGHDKKDQLHRALVDVEIDRVSLLEEMTRYVRQNAIARKGQPEGLEDWYINEHIPTGYSTRDADLAAARKRFGPWTKDRETLRDLREGHAPASWKKPGPKNPA